MRIDFARLNHILIPKTKAERDRFRQGWAGRLLLPVFGGWNSLTDEGRTLAIVTPLAGAVAADVRRTSAYLVFAILVGLLVGSLIAARWLRLVETSLEVSAPRRVAIGDEIVFRIRCARALDSAVRAALAIRIRGPFLPWDGTWSSGPPDEMLIAPGEHAETRVSARFVARGLHHLDPFTAAIVAPLGLACGPRATSHGFKVIVVPRIAKVLKVPLALASKHQPGGVALASKAGESMDLLGVRPYRPGDPVRDLHARTWARTGKPAVREYQQEYFTRVGVVLDTSLRDPDQLEAAIELAAGVIAWLSRGEALIDVLVVGEQVHDLTLGRSLGRLEQALDLLASVERGPALDAARLVTKLEPHLTVLSSVIAIVAEASSPSERTLLERELRDRGIAATTLVVDKETTKAIRAGESLAW